MISRFFIHRPIVAIVISIITVIMGAVVLAGLPISEFPDIVPPEVQIQATYVGADAQTLEQSVAVPIEQEMSGVENMNYVTSVNSASGIMQMTVNFEVGTDINTDLILTQLRVSQAASQLPPEVTAQGVIVQKTVSIPMVLISLYSPNNTYDAKFLANYGYVQLKDALSRVQGVGSIQIFGASRYAVRLWVKPDRLTQLGVTVPDIVRAVQAQNTVNPAGKLGGEPAPPGQEFTYTVRAQGRLQSPEQFGDIIIRETSDGGAIHLRDVARIELALQDYSYTANLNGKPTAMMAIYQVPGSNALKTAEAVKQLMIESKKRFPKDLEYVISLDTTRSVSAGITEIVETLVIAIALVVLVVYLFLQGWRATLIPLLAVPVSLVGTFIFFPLLGFSINTLSLFGLVLAIGLVVDDAIVVVEAVEHHIEEGMAPKEAALKAMEEITGPVIGIALVLTAVFVPTIFVPGITGRLYQQFAVTIAISVVLSAFNALSLSPALAAMLLKPKSDQRKGLLGKFFDGFNRGFTRLTNGYVSLSGALIRKSFIVIILLVLSGMAASWFGGRLPNAFLPDEDPGYAMGHVQLPDAASLQRTQQVLAKLEKEILKVPGVKYVTPVAGFSLLSQTQTTNSGLLFMTLDPWQDRKTRDKLFQEIQLRINMAIGGTPEAIAFAFAPPAIPGVGTSSGVTFILEDRSGKDVTFLAQQLGRFLEAVKKRPEIGMALPSFMPAVPQQFVEVDRDKVLKQGVALEDVYRTVQAFMGGVFVNYFNLFGRQWQVYVQAEADYRNDTKKLDLFSVRAANGDMVPLAGLTKFELRPGPEYITHYNLYKAVTINVSAAPGYSSGQAMKALEEVFEQNMPPEMGYDYSGMSFQEKKAQEGVSSSMVFGFSLLFVFLILAALYESWTLPFSVLLSTPIAVLGAFGALWLRHAVASYFYPAHLVQIQTNLYSQIGMIMLIGLAAKNSILIVEFAKDRYEKGTPLVEAALEGARLRLRPILMTSFAFILGCVPLWTASGAGSVARQIMGTTVIGGMLAASLFGIFLVPALFVIVERIAKRK